uniref:GOLD domain-containing protein n=1 Tax=Wuchereria bancrofti TaxID=6293 RepID=A0A1I8EI24_WUCBA
MRDIYAVIMILCHIVSFLLPIYVVVAEKYDYTVIVPAGKMGCYGFTIFDEKYHSFEVCSHLFSSTHVQAGKMGKILKVADSTLHSLSHHRKDYD